MGRPGASPALDISGLSYARTSGPGAGFSLSVDELRLGAGKKLAIVGPSGCGKSTLLDIIALLRRPTECKALRIGSVDAMSLWQQEDFETCAAIRAQRIGVILQTGGLLPYLPLHENLSLPLRLLGVADPDRVRRLMVDLELSGLERRLPAELSVGQRQRAAVGRALVHGPGLVLADEPTASLGQQHADVVMALLTDLCAQAGSALVIASHDIDLLERHDVPMRFFGSIDSGQHLGPMHVCA